MTSRPGGRRPSPSLGARRETVKLATLSIDYRARAILALGVDEVEVPVSPMAIAREAPRRRLGLPRP